MQEGLKRMERDCLRVILLYTQEKGQGIAAPLIEYLLRLPTLEYAVCLLHRLEGAGLVLRTPTTSRYVVTEAGRIALGITHNLQFFAVVPGGTHICGQAWERYEGCLLSPLPSAPTPE